MSDFVHVCGECDIQRLNYHQNVHVLTVIQLNFQLIMHIFAWGFSTFCCVKLAKIR